MTAKDLKKKLFFEPKHLSDVFSEKQKKDAFKFAEGYKDFLNSGKTERLVAKNILQIIKKEGFKEFSPGVKYKKGDKIYYNNRERALIIAIIGEKGLENGVKMIASHIDCPRLDLKPRPFYEDSDLALAKTHYFGGIRKYQWVTIPLSLHGLVMKSDGTSVDISIGEDEGDPVFVISDLLPHLSGEQNKRTLVDGIKGEELNLIIGSLKFDDSKEAEQVKLNILNILYEKYGLLEKDFVSAELEAVPAFKASDVGLDRSMIGAYGHDDRVCAYTSLIAALEVKNPKFTTVTVFADKEETGSNSNSGLATDFFKNFIYDLAKPFGVDGYTVLAKSKCLSADVTAAMDPTFPSVLEKNNAAYLNRGVGIAKYTGSRGKGGTSDATAEFMGEITALFDGAGVPWQAGELGKVDEGGGGTVAVFLAALDMDVLDVGVPVISMHSPFELVSKFDTYSAYLAYKAFYEA